LRYVDMLHEAIRRLRTFPNLGSDRSDISLGLRSIVAGEHIVFYRVLTGVIQITKVMHTREDASSHIDRDGI